jgi:serine/threonine protein kinase
MNVSDALPSAPLAIGDELGRYELVCPIAEGGMASVWVARLRGKHGFEKLVAIKMILPRFATDPLFRDMFLDEARIASRIEHPNVAQMFDLGEERELLYLVMEYVDGDALSKLNRSCQKKGVKIPTGVVLRVLADACAGLHEAHELTDGAGKPLGIVHRDISPHNILVSTKGIVKLIDFGIAKTDSADVEDNGTGALKGKLQYMAPEQALGRPVDRRADVWGVGAILYHLLAGRAPYEGDNQLATLHRLGSGLPPATLPPEVHPAIAAVACGALAQDPAERFDNAAEMREAIEQAMVVAQLTTTSADVSAFWTEHLAGRAQRRHEAIERALATMAERVRVEGPTAAASPKQLESEPPAGSSSYATPGSATLDASRPTANVHRGVRTPPVSVLGFILGFTIVTIFSMAVLQPRRSSENASATAAGQSVEPTASPMSSPSTSVMQAPPSSAPSSPRTTAASALPKAEPPTLVLSPPPRTAPEKRAKKKERPAGTPDGGATVERSVPF